MHLMIRSIRLLILVTITAFAACASAPPSTVIRTVYSPDTDVTEFSNILIISVTGTFQSRAQFERELVMAMSSSKVTAAAFYTVLGRNPQLTRSNLHNAIRNRGFDAVIFTRQKGQEQQELAPHRPVGVNLDLFGYDYDELNRDFGLQQAQAVTFITEVYSTATQRKVWAIESLSFDKATATELISEQSAMIAAQIKNDKLLAR